MALTLITAPSVEPVTTAEAKAQVRVDINDDDTLIAAQIVAARIKAEGFLRRALVTQTWELVMDAFPGDRALEIPLPPLQSVTSIKYTDSNGNESTFSSGDYIVDTDSSPGRVVLKLDASWPGDTLQAANGVRVRFVAGYGNAGSDVPQHMRQAILLMIGHWYENREETVATGNIRTIPLGAESLLWQDRETRW